MVGHEGVVVSDKSTFGIGSGSGLVMDFEAFDKDECVHVIVVLFSFFSASASGNE